MAWGLWYPVLKTCGMDKNDKFTTVSEITIDATPVNPRDLHVRVIHHVLGKIFGTKSANKNMIAAAIA